MKGYIKAGVSSQNCDKKLPNSTTINTKTQ